MNQIAKKLSVLSLIIIVMLPINTAKVTKASEMAGEMAHKNYETKLAAEYVSYCEEIGSTYHLSPELLESMIEKESNGSPDALGKNGDSGLMQVIPAWHADRMEELKISDIFDPYGNILVGADYVAELACEYNDLPLVLMIYNGTPVEEAIDRNTSGDFTEYANWIMERAQLLEQIHKK